MTCPPDPIPLMAECLNPNMCPKSSIWTAGCPLDTEETVGIQQDTKEYHLRDYFEKYGKMVPLRSLLIGSLARKEALDL